MDGYDDVNNDDNNIAQSNLGKDASPAMVANPLIAAMNSHSSIFALWHQCALHTHSI